MNTKFSILFYAKRAKSTTNGLIPIYLRVTADGKGIEFSTKRYTHSDKWSIEGSCMKGTTSEAKATNSYFLTSTLGHPNIPQLYENRIFDVWKSFLSLMEFSVSFDFGLQKFFPKILIK